MIFQISIDWMKFEDVTNETLFETVMLAHELFSVKTIIFTTVSFTNNVKDVQGYLQMDQVNKLIRTFCFEWNEIKANKTGVQNVMAIELGGLNKILLEENAKHLGYDISNKTYITERLGNFPKAQHAASIAQVCAERVTPNGANCVLNKLSLDGKNLCMKTYGGRIFAAIACLVGCIYNKNSIEQHERNQCSSSCNDQFMRLNPIMDSMYIENL